MRVHVFYWYNRRGETPDFPHDTEIDLNPNDLPELATKFDVGLVQTEAYESKFMLMLDQKGARFRQR